MITIGSTKIATNVMLAPMSGHSDLPFRMIARECGAKFCFFEMLDAHCLTRTSKRKATAVLNTLESDSPIAAQLLGNDPDIMLRAAKDIIDQRHISFLDINAACPVKKVVKRRSGAYLLRDHATLFAIIKKLASSLSVPVTVKIRAGYEEKNPAFIADMARGCQSSGASAVFVHGRTRLQGYSGEVDYDSIKAVKEALKIPVFGSGNIFDAPGAKKMFDLTGCNGILVARGAIGSPWIFQDIESYIEKGEATTEPPQALQHGCRGGLNLPYKEILKRHLAYIEKYRGESHAVKISLMRKAALFYLKGFPNAAEMRRKVSLVKEYEKMLELIDSL